MCFRLEICNGLEAAVSDVLLAKKFIRTKKNKDDPAEQNAQPDKENQGGWVIYFLNVAVLAVLCALSLSLYSFVIHHQGILRSLFPYLHA